MQFSLCNKHSLTFITGGPIDDAMRAGMPCPCCFFRGEFGVCQCSFKQVENMQTIGITKSAVPETIAAELAKDNAEPQEGSATQLQGNCSAKIESPNDNYNGEDVIMQIRAKRLPDGTLDADFEIKPKTFAEILGLLSILHKTADSLIEQAQKEAGITTTDKPVI